MKHPPRAVAMGAVLALWLVPAALFVDASGAEPSPQAAEEFQRLLDQGLTAFVDEKYQESIQSFNDALKIKPGDPTALNALKYAEEKFVKEGSKKNQAFEKEIDKAGRFIDQKEYIVAWMAIRSILQQSPRYKSALKLKDKLNDKMIGVSKKEKSDSYRHWVAVGVLQSIEGRNPEALKAWKKALELRPNDQIVQLAIEELLPAPPVSGGIASTVDDTQPCDCDLSSGTVKNPLLQPLGMVPQTLASLPVSAPFPAPVRAPAPASAPTPAPKKVAVNPEPVKKVAPAPTPIPVSEPTSAPVSPPAPAAVPVPAPVSTPASVQAQAPVPTGSESSELLRRGDYAGAIRLLQGRVTDDPTDLNAKELLNQALQERERASNVRYRSGLLAYARGDFSGAIEDWKQALKIYPEHPNAKKVMLRAFFKNR